MGPVDDGQAVRPLTTGRMRYRNDGSENPDDDRPHERRLALPDPKMFEGPEFKV